MADYSNWHDHPFLAEFRALLAIPAPPGREQRIARAVSDRLTQFGCEPATDAMGNVTVHLPGADADAPRTMLAAHMDEIAAVICEIEPDGVLHVMPSGGLEPDKLGEGPVDIVGDDDTQLTTGVTMFGSGHVISHTPRARTWQDVRVATGLTAEQLADRGVRVGSPLVPSAFRRGPVLMGDPADPLVAAWTFDDRAGVVTMLRLIEWLMKNKQQPAGPTTFAFTVQEEAGCHGAVAVAQREQPEVFIAIDGTPRTPRCPLTLDGRPCAWSRDFKASYDHRLIASFAAAARQADTQLQTAVFETAWSDASTVLCAGATQRALTFGHVRDNSHGFEIAPLLGFDLALETLKYAITQPL